MLTQPRCLPCFVEQALRAAAVAEASQEHTEAILRQTLAYLRACSWRAPPPELAIEVHRIVRRITGVDDPYLAGKRRMNALAARILPLLREQLAAAPDPFIAALRLAMAGNVIDLAIYDAVDQAMVLEATSTALAEALPVDHGEQLRQALLSADGPVLYAADNAGEIHFDRLLVEQILALGIPRERLVLLVRGGPAINDALLADARDAGLHELLPIMDSGIDAPGLLLHLARPGVQALYDRASVIIAKVPSEPATSPARSRQSPCNADATL